MSMLCQIFVQQKMKFVILRNFFWNKAKWKKVKDQILEKVKIFLYDYYFFYLISFFFIYLVDNFGLQLWNAVSDLPQRLSWYL